MVTGMISCDSIKNSAEYIFNKYKVSSPSMSPNFEVGTRLSVISVPEDSLKSNYVVAFYPPSNLWFNGEKSAYISRLIATSGDVIEMKKQMIYLNGKVYPYVLKLKHSFIVNTTMPLNGKTFKDFEYYQKGENVYSFFATPEQVTTLINKKGVITSVVADTISYDYHMLLGTERDNWGPIQIPKKGDQIILSDSNAKWLVPLLTEYEKETIEFDREYTLSKNYYLMISDNRHNALDGRYMGLIPEDQIIGRAIF
jgi:signal peptidase I